MVLIKKIIILFFLFVCSFSFAQHQLIYTDNYQTNIFTSSDNYLRFNNNYFALIDAAFEQQILDLIDAFFLENKINATRLPSEKITQYKYSLIVKDANEYLKWSKVWHQKYQSKLNLILGDFSKEFLKNYSLSYPNIELAMLTKNAFYFYKNYKNRRNEFSNTRLVLQVNNISSNKFLKENIEPNNSLNRIVTNSLSTIYNETLKIENLKNNTSYYYGPTSKSRLIDCLSMHIYCNYYDLSPPQYSVNTSYFSVDSSQATSKDLEQVFKKSLEELNKIMNDPSTAFYNNFDLKNLDLDYSTYTNLNYLESFKEIYISNKKYTIGTKIEDTIGFNLYSLEDSILFKSNSVKYKKDTDSLKLIKIAAFLKANPSAKINIFGKANQSEYTKVEKKSYIKLIQKYQSYNPVKISKKVDLSLYRALILFVKLESYGVSPLKMECTSKIMVDRDASFQNVSFQIIQ